MMALRYLPLEAGIAPNINRVIIGNKKTNAK
jgi:hypothetical protein